MQTLPKKTAQLNVLVAKDVLREILEGEDLDGVDMVFPFVTLFLDRSAGLEASWDLTSVNVLYIDTINKMLLNHRKEQWV